MNFIDRNRIIVVTGPGRSGTSVVTRGLTVLGVDLGGNLMPPKPGVNDKGFWEDLDIFHFNEDMLNKLRYSWDNLMPVRECPENCVNAPG